MDTSKTLRQAEPRKVYTKMPKKLSHDYTMRLIKCSTRTHCYTTLFKKMENGTFPFDDAIAVDMVIRITLGKGRELLSTLLDFVKNSGAKISYSAITINKIFNMPIREEIVKALFNGGDFEMLDHIETIQCKVGPGAKADLQCTVNALLERKHFLEEKRRCESE